jgi:hypothetical protein
MKISSLGRGFASFALISVLAVCLSGCASCKPGVPGKPQAYEVKVILDSNLLQSSVVVDLVGVNSVSLPRWENYSMTDYWKAGDAMSHDADKVTLSFVSGNSSTNRLARTDPKWTSWLAKGATHLLVLADLPGAPADKPGTQDARRQILPLGRCAWPNKTKTLTVQVHKSGPEILTPTRAVK